MAEGRRHEGLRWLAFALLGVTAVACMLAPLPKMGWVGVVANHIVFPVVVTLVVILVSLGPRGVDTSQPGVGRYWDIVARAIAGVCAAGFLVAGLVFHLGPVATISDLVSGPMTEDLQFTSIEYTAIRSRGGSTLTPTSR